MIVYKNDTVTSPSGATKKILVEIGNIDIKLIKTSVNYYNNSAMYKNVEYTSILTDSSINFKEGYILDKKYTVVRVLQISRHTQLLLKEVEYGV